MTQIKDISTGVEKACGMQKTGRVPMRRILATVALPLLIAGCSKGTETNYQPPAKYTNIEGSSIKKVSRKVNLSQRSSLLSLAMEMAATGDHAAAIPLFRRAHNWHSGDATPLVGLGDSLRAIGQYQEAVDVYSKALDQNAKNTQALKGLGKTYIALSRPTMAVPVLNDAVKLRPRDMEAISGLALALELQGHAGAAHAVYEDGLGMDPDNLKLLNNYGLSLALNSRHDEAIEILKQAAQHRDAGASHRQNLAMAYALSGNEVMSSRLLSIDNGPDLTDENLNYYRILASLPEEDRFDAVIRQSTSPKTDIKETANRAYDDDSRTRKITVARLVETPPEPEVVVVPEPAPVVEEDENIPPLLGPQGWALQIAAYRKKTELMPGWEMLKKKYADIIGDLEPRRSEIDFGDREGSPSGFYYRLNAGPLTSLEEANEACRKIRERGTDCWVRIPEVAEGSVSEKDAQKAEQFREKVYSSKKEDDKDI